MQYVIGICGLSIYFDAYKAKFIRVPLYSGATKPLGISAARNVAVDSTGIFLFIALFACKEDAASNERYCIKYAVV
ncbi:MAG: hypothetical protein K2N38_01880 [Oscillospiraceae bacterium]|nr:hypothetical protein [Oscillospiraceae bacterium]